MNSRKSLQGSFDLSSFLPRKKTDDEIAVERIVAADMRESREEEPAGRELVRQEMRRKILEQKAANLANAGIKPPKTIAPKAEERMASYVERKSRR